MLRHLLAACATLACAAPAFSQSSVNLSGIVDLAVRHGGSDAGSLNSLASGANSTSRLVFTGREDLGNGMSAGFHLEHGFLADSGSPAAADKFFDRRSTLSLSSRALGELRMGRDFVPSYVAWSRHDPFSYVGVARSATLVSATPAGPIRSAFGTNPNTTVRSDNAVQLLLPAGLGGLEGGFMVAARENGDAVAGRANVVGARLGFGAKGFHVSGAVTRSRNNLTAAGQFTDAVLGGQVDVSNLKFSAAWRQFKEGQSKQALMLLGVVAAVGAHEFKASWVKTDFSGRVGAVAIDANGASQWGIGYVHNLSKRTALYATVARVGNEGAARYAVDGPAPTAGGSSRGYEVGLRHRF